MLCPEKPCEFSVKKLSTTLADCVQPIVTGAVQLVAQANRHFDHRAFDESMNILESALLKAVTAMIAVMATRQTSKPYSSMVAPR